MAKSFMFQNTSTENRKKQREEKQIELREKKREELLNKKRTMAVDDASIQISDFKVKKDLLLSKDPQEVWKGINQFRTSLSVENSPPIQSVIDSGLVPRFVELLSAECSLYKNADKRMVRSIRMEAAWALTNIASGTSEQTQAILDYGAIPLFADMLKENDEDLVDQAAWAFGNIAGDSEKMRDAAINCDVLKIVISLAAQLLKTNASLRVLKNCTWLVSNLNRGRNPPPKLENMKASLEVLQQLINYKDDEVLNDTLWALSYICDNSAEAVDMVYSTDVLDKTLNILRNHYEYNSVKVMLPAIRMVGNIITGKDEHVDMLLKRDVVGILKDIFQHFQGDVALKKLRKEICWIFSNIACGTKDHISCLVNEHIMDLLYSTTNLQNYIKMEACWAITNMMSHCEECFEHFELVLSGKYFLFLDDCLESFDTYTEIRIQILKTMKRVITAAREWQVCKTGSNKLFETRQINKIDKLMETIEGLQYGSSDELRNLAEAVYAEYTKDDEFN
ncbi:hypothetical protein VCUG_01743 [Vavraia culicis subsp. floridensis]|uniref:Importin subunit alpha n=1 Tax=Vavraia culicis (isolate floridensis) TaxID=948595 RepID=L2GT27_VAVCU|nr:uncharacterized protein VCUG_01743 [Vavraia culicis subsp. floridensis]ELA46784.1 hypothetical protein VCUG_01743 [Vavraia culicis subsp. floridensis]